MYAVICPYKNECAQNGFTALHLASQDGHEDMAGLLLERGADVNWIAKNGLTPLHLTAQEDAVPVASILVKYGAQIDPKTKVSALSCCVIRRSGLKIGFRSVAFQVFLRKKTVEYSESGN